MTGYSFSTPVWDGRTWVRPAVAEVAAAPKVNGPEDQPRERDAPAEWSKIDWREQEGQVRRLRLRIFKASQEQDWPKTRNLHYGDQAVMPIRLRDTREHRVCR